MTLAMKVRLGTFADGQRATPLAAVYSATVGTYGTVNR